MNVQMSAKRKSTESSSDEQHEECSNPLKQDGHAKREKLNRRTDTTIQDLPYKHLECILAKVVVMEVRDLKLAKCVWKEKADLVINRLKTVCSQWCTVLTTDSFRTKLNAILDNTAQTIRLEILQKSPINAAVQAMTTVKDEIFMLHEAAERDFFINVHDRNDLETVKDVIPLPRSNLFHMKGCNASNCVYVSVGDEELDGYREKELSLWRISKESDVEGKFKTSPWESSHRTRVDMMRIASNGSVIIYSEEEGRLLAVVSIYDANGFLENDVPMPLDCDEDEPFYFTYHDLLLNSNGNLVVAYVIEPVYKTRLMEIDRSGSVERLYESSFKYCEESCVGLADEWGRIVITDPQEGIELLDSEFNLLGLYSLQQDVSKILFVFNLHYDSERKEVACIGYDVSTKTNILTAFRFAEE